MQNEFIGKSNSILKIKETIDKIAVSELNTVVQGETGVGKEVVVQELYKKSKRFGKPFQKINCAALPEALLESEMFGYEKGAFTGANSRMHGKFQQADGGILFLDEIGDMPLALQSKLLRALQDGSFTPLGSETSLQSDVWIIAATNRDINKGVEKGEFRRDLYYRINVVNIHLDPLRKRIEDIPLLIDYYTKIYAAQYNNNQPIALSTLMKNRLCEYHWPGNVRELQNVLKKLAVFGECPEIMDELLQEPQKAIRFHNDKHLPVNVSNWPNPQLIDYEFSQGTDLSLKRIKKN